MSSWHDALRTYRRSAAEPRLAGGSSVLFVLCTKNRAAAQLIAGCPTAMALQQLSAGADWSEPGTRATLEYAIEVEGVRKIVVCGHLERGSAPVAIGQSARQASQHSVAEKCMRLRRDGHLARLLRERRVIVTPIWLDDEEGDLFECDVEGGAARLLSDEAFGRLVADRDRSEL